jgi:hypothetical protein
MNKPLIKNSLKLSCEGCKYALSKGYYQDEDDLVHDEGCEFYKPEQIKVDWIEIKRLRYMEAQTAEVEKALIRWRGRVSEYLSLGEKESDPIGKKFYESYALGVANCIAEVEGIFARREPNAV